VILHIEAGGRSRSVEVGRNNGGFTVSVDGREHTVDVHEVGGTWSLLLGTRSYEVAFVEGPDGAMMVHVDGEPVPVFVAPLRPAWGARGRGAGRGSGTAAGSSTALGTGPQRIAAPMPGKIVKVLVKPGDAVDARQCLVIVEAMKMENELRSQKAGTVSEVRVKEGASVEAGAILVIVE
jgi:biotin carboxyl carrier protein